MTATLIGYARCSTDVQDLTAQRHALTGLGVAADRIYLDKGLTGTNRHRPASTRPSPRSGPATPPSSRSWTDSPGRYPTPARSATTWSHRSAKLSLGGSVYDPADPMGKMFFNILATFAEFEVNLLRMRTREGMAVARAKGKLRGKQPKLTDRQQRELVV
jgi:DNA invertase Pin-like site-specific DNA recombinase